MGKLWRNLVGASLIGVALASTIGVTSVAADYYASITNTTNGEALADDLSSLISSTHKHQLSYDGLWDCYETSDVLPGTNKIWDTYSEYLYAKGTDQAGSYKKEGDAYNREHTVPQSWFNEASPMRGDAYHVLPTDGYVNNRRSSYVYGETDGEKYTSENGSKLGSSKLSGYSGTVFEPIDEYKGDIARGIMYMAIRYKNKVGNWSKGEAQKIFKGSYPYLTDYALDLFTKWSHQDPVSDKEIIRNDAIYDIQGNRNPFIDHPEYADVIWENSYQDGITATRYSASDVVDAVNGLSGNSSASDVYKAYAKYCRLNTTDKALVTNQAELFSYVESVSNTSLDLGVYWENITKQSNQTVDEAKVSNVIELINSLPLEITLKNESQVNDAQSAYIALNSKEKSLVTNYSKLSSAIQRINQLKNQDKIDSVIALIDLIPSPIKESDKVTITNAYDAYMALDEGLRGGVTNASKLLSAYEALDLLTFIGYKKVLNESELHAGDNVLIVNVENKKALGPVVSNYYRAGIDVTISNDSIVLDENSTVTVLTLASGTNANTFAFDTKDGYLVPSTTTYKNLCTEDTITENSSYNITITDGVASIISSGGVQNGIMVYDITHKDFSSAPSISSGQGVLAIFKYRTPSVDEEKINEVIGLITKLPIDITLEDKAYVSNVKTKYDNLNSLEKTYVTNVDVLDAALEKIHELELMDSVDDLIELIDNLPNTITLNDESVTKEARHLYDQLPLSLTKYVTNYSKLVEKEAEVKELFKEINEFRDSKTLSSLKFNYSVSEVQTQNNGYNLITSISDLFSGDKVVIASSSSNDGFGPLSGSIGTNVSITKSGNSLSSIGSSIIFELEEGSASNKFYFKSEGGYLVSTAEKKVSFVSDKNNADEWALDITSDNIIDMTNGTNYLRFNTSSPRFTTYSQSKNVGDIVFYKGTSGKEEKYSVSNAYIRFGNAFETELYQALLNKGENVSFGIELSKNGIEFNSYTLNPVYVDEIGAKTENPDGNYVQYSAVIPVSVANYSTTIYARGYVLIDGIKFYSLDANYSLKTLAEYYIENASELGITDTIVNALGEFLK